MAGWSQLLTGGAMGAVVTWIGGIAKTGFEHILSQSKERKQEERTIRAEKRELSQKQDERRRLEVEQLRKDEATLLMYTGVYQPVT